MNRTPILLVLAVLTASCSNDSDLLGPQPPDRDTTAAIQNRRALLHPQPGRGRTDLRADRLRPHEHHAWTRVHPVLHHLRDGRRTTGRGTNGSTPLGGAWPDCLRIPIPRLETGDTWDDVRHVSATPSSEFDDFAPGTSPPGIYRLRLTGQAFLSCTDESCDHRTLLPDTIFTSNAFVLR